MGLTSIPSGICQIVVRDADNQVSSIGTGILIDPNWVLTAAHVCENAELNELSVSLVPGSVPVAVTAIHLHPDYRKNEAQHDMAVVRLAEPASADLILPLLNDSLWYLRRYQTRIKKDQLLRCYGRPNIGGELAESEAISLSQLMSQDDEIHTLQLAAGLAEGFSGGPAVVWLKGHPACVGMALKGGLLRRTLATSSVIMGAGPPNDLVGE